MPKPVTLVRAFRAALFAALLVALPSLALAQSTATLYAVTPTNRLLTLSSTTPGVITRSVALTNLAPGETMLGIDVRPATRQLYGVSSTSQLYLIDVATGIATKIGAPMTPALTGPAVGFDFNPTVDRIRIVSTAGQNLRVNPETAVAIVDGPLAYAPTDRNAGVTARVVASGYTNPDTNPATGTQLFAIDSGLNAGLIQDPPNNGTLNTYVPLGLDVTDTVSLDFNLTDAFIAAQEVGAASSTLLQVTAGVIRNAGPIGGGELVTAMAVSLGTPITAPAGVVYALTTTNEVAAFNADTPGTLLGRGPVSNLLPGERLLGLDFRPATNLLYAIGSTGQLYLIDTATAAASRVGVPLALPLSGQEFGFDFNPAVDRIRLVSDSGQNLRLHPDLGTIAATDVTLSYNGSDRNAGRTPRVTAAAYTNPDTDPATGTTLFVIDSGLDIGAIQDPPNAGVLNTYVALGADLSDLVGFDIGRTRLLISAVPSGTTVPFLYDVTGAPRLLGAIGTPSLVRDIAISLGR